MISRFKKIFSSVTKNTPIVNEQIHLFLNQSPYLLIGTIATMLIFVWFFWNRVDYNILFTWLAINLCLVLIRMPIVVFYKRNALRLKPNNLVFGWIFALFSFIAGCTWGASTWVLMDPTELFEVAFIYILIPSTVTGVTVSLSTFLPIYLAYSSSALGMLALALLFRGQSEHVFFGLLIIIFFFVNLSFAIMINRNLIESIKLRFNNLDLIQKLRSQKDIAEKANQDKTRFLAAASHDLRQPMQAMLLFSSTLNDKLTVPEHKKLLHRIMLSQDSISEMLDSLLDISKLDANIIQANMMNFKLQTIFNRIEEEFVSSAESKNLKLKIRPTNARLYSDPQHIYRILQNLVANAIRYTNEGGILLVCRSNQQHYSIEVWDTGIGIKTEQYQQIFQEFYQVNNPERDRQHGLGLGLAIVQRLTQLLDIPLNLNSHYLQGSVFKLKVISGNKQHLLQSTKVESYNDEPNNNKNKLILIIDDDSEILDALGEQLISWGFQVCRAQSLELAIEQLKNSQSNPDLIISDYRLAGDKNGAKIIEKVRQFLNNLTLPAIIVTGDTSPERIKESKQSGFPILHKPLKPAKLRAQINNSLKD